MNVAEGGKPRLLLVDDSRDNLEAMLGFLGEDYVLAPVHGADEAVALARTLPQPELVLIDMGSPGTDGYALLRMLKSNAATADIPVIMLMDRPEPGDEARGLRMGAADYIARPVNEALLRLRVLTQLELRRYRRKPANPDWGPDGAGRGASRILVVDDAPENIHHLISVLSDEYRIVAATDGPKAMEIVLGANPPDLVLLDIMMPVMDGYEVCRRIKATAIGNEIPVIFLSAVGATVDRVRGFSIGAADFITKPFDPDDVRARIRNHLELSQLHRFFEQTVEQRTTALRRSEAELSEALRISKLAYWEYEFATDEFVFNDQYFSLHGITAEQIGGYRQPASGFCRQYVHPEDLPVVERAIAEAAESADPDRLVVIETRAFTAARQTIWLEARIKTERDAGTPTRLVGVSQDITARKQAELVLWESERRFNELLENVELLSMMCDRQHRITYCNDYLLRLTGWQREDVIGRRWAELFLPPEASEETEALFDALLRGRQEARHHDGEIVTRSGARRMIHWNNMALRDALGEVLGTASIGEDITDRRAAEAKNRYLNRVYAVLGGINALMARVGDRQELFREACRICVEEGEFRMAMVCILDPESRQILPAATAGMDPGLLSRINRVMASADAEQSMLFTAIATGQNMVSNDSAGDTRLIFRQEYNDSGVRSLAMLPLIVTGEAIGVLALYSSELDFFRDEEMKLLNDLAGDVAFSIDHIEKRERIDHLAYYDALTGLANRTLFLERAAQHLRRASISGGTVAVCLVDIERFKNINDSLGRTTGDALLRQVAQRFTRETGDIALVARIHADHFALVLPELVHEGDLPHMVERLIKAINGPSFDLSPSEFHVAAKMGIAVFPEDGGDADTLFRHAEAALKKAKNGGERYLFYTEKMTEAVAEKLSMENQLRDAIGNGEFVLHYQPKIDLESGAVTSAEALIRWNNPRTGLVPPGKFIPILEETGMIYEVGRWALGQAIDDNRRWRDAGHEPLRIAVNVSPLQLRDRNFITEIGNAVSVDPHAALGLELEITESLVMADVIHSIASLRAIRGMGITIAIDDFGTGYSSLSYLARLPVDTLKIDRSFVVEMTQGPEGLALVSTIISLAHSLKLKVVAEGVETGEQSRQLRLLGCDEMQGFLFSKAVPADVFESKFLAARATATH